MPEFPYKQGMVSVEILLTILYILLIAVFYICYRLYESNKKLSTKVIELEKTTIPYLKQLDDENYRFWKAKLRAEEKLRKLQKSPQATG